MVRLRALLTETGSAADLSFQFQYGTIKSGKEIQAKSMLLDFNSSMVRLRVAGRDFVFRRRLFQFQYGTIKSLVFSYCEM